jgi:hypothetical protein
MGGAEEARADHVAQSVVLLVEGENRSGGHACV